MGQDSKTIAIFAQPAKVKEVAIREFQPFVFKGDFMSVPQESSRDRLEVSAAKQERRLVSGSNDRHRATRSHNEPKGI
jgi:hypothetical protein